MDRIIEIAKYSLVDIEDPVNLAPVVLVAFCVFWSGCPSGLAWWAMFNGCLIHFYMDGIVGIFGRGPKWLVEQYGKLDVRYWQTQDPMVMTISAVEMVIMTPLCIIWYHSVVQKRWYCHAVAIMTSTFQLMGCILYVGAEILDGFKHLPSILKMNKNEVRWAVQNGDLDKLNELFSKGMDANMEMPLGRRPLHIAADYGQQDVLEILLAKGADINAQDTNGITPLLATIWEKHLECARYLLNKGASPNGKAPDGSTYVEAAETNEMKELLKQHGAK